MRTPRSDADSVSCGRSGAPGKVGTAPRLTSSGHHWGPLGTTPSRATGISWGINYLEVKKKPLGLVNHAGCAKQKATLSAAATADLR